MTPETKRILEQQTITMEGPGSILRDFQTLLDFLGLDGVKTPGKMQLIPMAKLAELDEQMTSPLKPRMKRPGQVHYPYIHGLYLLLRASGLGISKGLGKSARLVLDEAMHEQWQRLNPTEQYFNLLEAWLLRAEPSMIGEEHGWRHYLSEVALRFSRHCPEKELTVRNNDSLGRFGIYRAGQHFQLALLDLFGLAAIERREPREGEDWPITRIRRVPFGDAMFELFDNEFFEQIRIRGLNVLREEDEMEEDDEENLGVRQFGVFQPLLQDFFPEWQNNLFFPQAEFREGVFELTASLDPDCWRRIAISAYDTLDDLAWAIIKAFDFDGDHLYEFELRQPDGQILRVGSPGDGVVDSNEIQVGYLPLEVGQSMPFLYDFGASWEFDVQLESIEPEKDDDFEPKVVAEKGEAPEEYPLFD